MAVRVKVTRSGDADVIRAQIDDVGLKFDAKGNAARDLEEGDHVFSWIIEGGAKQTYNVRIVSPLRAAAGAKGSLKAKGRIIGAHPFSL